LHITHLHHLCISPRPVSYTTLLSCLIIHALDVERLEKVCFWVGLARLKRDRG